MSAATDGFNRALLTLLGLVFVAAGVLGIALYAGWLQDAAGPTRPVLEPSQSYEQLRAAVSGRPELWWPVIGAVAAVLGLLGLWWALRQVPEPGPRITRTTLATGDRGTTRLDVAAAERALAQDLRRVPGVSDSHVRVTELTASPRLDVGLDLAAGADHGQVREGAEACYERFVAALGRDGLAVDTTLRLERTPQTRVV